MTRFFPLLLGLFVVASACAQDGGMDHGGMDHDASMADHHMMPPMRGTDDARVSPNGGVMTTVGTTNVMVHYGRPSLNDRTYFADGATLAPAGSVWRTGANEASAITFAGDVMVNGTRVPAGTYGLFTIPGDTWTVIFNTTAEQWGSMNYDEAADQARVMAEPITDAPMQEQFEIRFADVTEDSATMILHWGTVGVPVTIAEAGM